MATQGPTGGRLARLLRRVATGVASGLRTARPDRARTPSTAPRPASEVAAPVPAAPRPASADPAASAPGDVTVEYAPRPDGHPDPGEVVWAWVPFEDDPAQGKDRPVLVIGHEGPTLLALMLTSKDHDRDAAQEAHWGRYWMDVGAGAWDRERRPSEVRLDRLLRLDPDGVRREGCALDRVRYDAVVAGFRQHEPPHGRPSAGW